MDLPEMHPNTTTTTTVWISSLGIATLRIPAAAIRISTGPRAVSAAASWARFRRGGVARGSSSCGGRRGSPVVVAWAPSSWPWDAPPWLRSPRQVQEVEVIQRV
ncbi:unnamed protein product, partial [Musa acuminata subsp. burmannicoides]